MGRRCVWGWLCIGLLTHTPLGALHHRLHVSDSGLHVQPVADHAQIRTLDSSEFHPSGTGCNTSSTPQTAECVQPAGRSTLKTKIPLIMHHIYLSGFDAYVSVTQRPAATMQRWYYDSCVEVHKHWQIMFWTQEMAENLIKEHYDWFLPIWHSYDMEVKRADVIRAFILLHYGGLYLDLDNQCYRPAEEAFKDYDVVLQGTGFEGVNNGMMASAPGHPLWEGVIQLMKERYKGSDTDPWQNNPLFMTGPALLSSAVERYLNLPRPVSGFVDKVYSVDDLTVKVYPLGKFFVPCWAADAVCNKQYEKGLAAGSWDMTDLVGRHWFAGSWNKPWLLLADAWQKDRTLLAQATPDAVQVLSRP